VFAHATIPPFTPPRIHASHLQHESDSPTTRRSPMALSRACTTQKPCTASRAPRAAPMSVPRPVSPKATGQDAAEQLLKMGVDALKNNPAVRACGAPARWPPCWASAHTRWQCACCTAPLMCGSPVRLRVCHPRSSRVCRFCTPNPHTRTSSRRATHATYATRTRADQGAGQRAQGPGYRGRGHVCGRCQVRPGDWPVRLGQV
jgi:hypothetical protein